MPHWSIDHISAVTLAVRDMAESVVFYERLGLHVSYGGPNDGDVISFAEILDAID